MSMAVCKSCSGATSSLCPAIQWVAVAQVWLDILASCWLMQLPRTMPSFVPIHFMRPRKYRFARTSPEGSPLCRAFKNMWVALR